MDNKKKESEKAAQTAATPSVAASAPAEKPKAKSALELLEEDDEFEVSLI